MIAVAVVAVTFVVVVMSDFASVRLAVDLQNQRSVDLLLVEMFEQVFVVRREAGRLAFRVVFSRHRRKFELLRLTVVGQVQRYLGGVDRDGLLC